MASEQQATPYWLVRFMCEPFEGKRCEDNECTCSDRQLCITESCRTCVANWWLRNNGSSGKAEIPHRQADR